MNKEIYDLLVENINKTVRFNREGDKTLIGLPFPYTVPCEKEHFQELFYWDTYFVNVGLLKIGNTELAKNNVDNILYLVDKYGYMPNSNRTWHLGQSQPPFLSLMVKDIFEVTKDKSWLKNAYDLLKREYSFWQNRRIAPNGLNGYLGYNIWNDKDAVRNYAEDFAKRAVLEYDVSGNEEEIFWAAKSVCESGWDLTSRFFTADGRYAGHKYNAVDLNCLLYGVEENMRCFSEILELGEEKLWEERKSERLTKMKYLWSEKDGLYLDRNYEIDEFSPYKSIASLYPLYVNMATSTEAEKALEFLDKTELSYGVTGGLKENAKYRFDYPNGWAPLQFITYKALKNYGYDDRARRVAEKYINVVERTYAETECFWEKYNVEIGTVGVGDNKNEKQKNMVGWTAGVYLYFTYELL